MLGWYALLALLSGSWVYCFLVVVAARRYLAVRPLKLERLEPVSILKPLYGLDPGLESNLRTFFEQDYAAPFEILFAVRDAQDAAGNVVRKLQAEYASVPSRLLVTGEPPYPNAKVFSLDRMMSQASYDLLVMSDSDIRVTPALLRVIAAEFQDPKLGVATCPYRAIAGNSFWSRLEATGMNTDFHSGVLVARMLEGMNFAVGPTIVARKRVLQSIGGFDRLKDYLAEDFVMGKFAAEAGHGVSLSSYVVEHHIGSQSFGPNAAHRLRWCRSTRRSRPAGYLGQLFTMPVPIAMLVTVIHPLWWPVLIGTFVIRFATAQKVAHGVLKAPMNWLLLPVEDLAAFAFWIAGFPDGRFQLRK
jgi:ceramide glucosyltransferase